MVLRCGILVVILVNLFGCGQQAMQTADFIVVNARVWTGQQASPDVDAFAVKDGRFVCVGGERDVRCWQGGDTQVIDAQHARIIPGLIDAHLHLIGGGLQLARLNLRNVADRAGFVRQIAERAAAAEPGEWILGGRWSTESWPDPTQPCKEWVDDQTPSNPLFLVRMDGHGALANSAALCLAGIDRNGPPNPPGGEIVRDPKTNEPTGLLRESAMELVRDLIPPPSEAARSTALKAAMREANRHGLTTVHTMSEWEDVATLDAASDRGELTLRVRLYVSEDDWRDFLAAAKSHRNTDWVGVPGFKAFMDGSLGSRTAYMAEPYSDNPPHEPDRRGLLGEVMSGDARLPAMVSAADKAGMNAAVHCIGDRANHLMLAIYADTAAENGERADRRMRIEHAQHLLLGDIARFAELDVVASMQPLHKADDARYAEIAIGAERCKTSYAFRSLLQSGAHVAFGSDWPVVSLNPFLGMHAAVTGRSLDGKTFVPEQNITIEEALACYTSGAAYAAGDEKQFGMIADGYLADFVILDRDLLNCEASELADIQPRGVFVEGRRVWPE